MSRLLAAIWSVDGADGAEGAAGADGDDGAPGGPADPFTRVARLVGAVAIVAGAVLCFVTRSDLWLDEALSVNIARLPLGDLRAALKVDGAPPLYYVVLHAWTAVWGEGDHAVRALSGLAAVASLPLAWFAGRRLGGPVAAGVTLVLTATSPYLVRYGTEARMYSLVVLLVFAGYLAVERALEQPTARRLTLVAVLAGLLVLLQYWALYLVAATVLALAAVWRTARRGGDAPRRRAALRTGAALAVGTAVFLAPWLPTFLYQRAHTGTPWGRRVQPFQALVDTVTDFGGPGGLGKPQDTTLGMLLVLFALVGLFAQPVDGRRLEVDLRTRVVARPIAFVGAATWLLGVAASLVSGVAYQSRYAAVAFPFFVLLVGLGVAQLSDRRVRAGALLVLVVLGFVGIGRNVVVQRTQAGELAAVLNAEGRPGDVVAFCPDQLGPDTARLLHDGFVEVTFPDAESPVRVDWVDYGERNRAADPVAFADGLVDRAGPGQTVWLVWNGQYRHLEGQCEAVATELAVRRPVPDAVRFAVDARSDRFESASLFRYPPV
jgi:mannosyltransferase